MKRTLASNVRRLRVAHHLSLSDLARATGVSKATLSGIEGGDANPTVETLAAVAAELHVGVGELLEEPQLSPIQIVRAERSSSNVGDVVSRQLDAISATGDLELIELSLPAHRVKSMDPRAAGSRSRVLVLQGKLIAGPVERVSELTTGDYMSFPADVPHVIEAGSRSARALVLAHTPRGAGS